MEVIKYFGSEWHVIGQAPATFAIALVLLASLVYAAASWRFGGIIETQQAKIALLETKLEGAPIAENAEKRRSLREQLARFLAEGESLDGRSRTEDVAIIEPLVESWATTIRDWLTANLDESYAQQFLSAAGLPSVMVTGQLTDEQRKISLWMHYRNVRLQEFIQSFR